MASTYVQIPKNASGPGGAVDSVNGFTGTVVLTKANIGLGNVDNTSDANKPVSTATQTALNLKQDALVAAANNQLFYQVSPGVIGSTDSLSLVPAYGSLSYNKTVEPNNLTGQTIQSGNLNVEPLQNSPNENYTLEQNNVNLDNTSSGFTFGTNDRAISITNNNVSNLGTGDIGEVAFLTNYLNIGNGTDPLNIRGFSYNYGFGNINANVNVNGPIQGYGFQPAFDPTATIDATTSYINAFYDFANLTGVTSGSYTTFQSSPIIGAIDNNRNFTGFNLNPTIPSFIGSAGFIGFGINGNLGTFGASGYFQGININPTITSVPSATGLYINMNNVTSANKKAMDIVGDVSINGALAFSGALSIGQLEAFYASNPVDGGGNPQNMHGLTTSMTALNGVTTANADVIGVNNAMLIELQANSINTSGPFKLGFAAVALPCVVETHTGSSLDYMNMAVYALNLAGTSTGGTINRVNGVRVEAIPNGVTNIPEFVAFEFDQLAGQVGTDVWGLHIVPTYAENFLGGSLAIGTSSEKVSSAEVALEIGNKKAFVPGRLTTIEIAALTPSAGWVVYDITLNKLLVYDGTTWVALH